jgi:hypothetical protein
MKQCQPVWRCYAACLLLAVAGQARDAEFPGEKWLEAAPASQGVDEDKLRAAAEALAKMAV